MQRTNGGGEVRGIEGESSHRVAAALSFIKRDLQ